MKLRLLTRHNKNFFIFAPFVDPKRSSYAEEFELYAPKVISFYRQLEVESGLWAVAREKGFEGKEYGKDIEYEIEVDASRVIAWIDTRKWDPYVTNDSTAVAEFTDFSHTPREYESTTILVSVPLSEDELIERRLIPECVPEVEVTNWEEMEMRRSHRKRP